MAENGNLGFLAGAGRRPHPVARQSRASFQSPIPPLQSGSKGTMMIGKGMQQQQRPVVNQSAQQTLNSKGKAMSSFRPRPSAPMPPATAAVPGSIVFPQDLQEKIQRWRAKREQDLNGGSGNAAEVMPGDDRNDAFAAAHHAFAKNQPYMAAGASSPSSVMTPTTPVSQHGRSNANAGAFYPEPPVRTFQQHQQPYQQQTQQQPHQQALQQDEPGSVPAITIVPAAQSQQQQQQQLQPQSSFPAVSSASSVFDVNAQQVLKGMIEFAVNKSVDDLCKKRPDIKSQEDVMQAVNNKTRACEERLQESVLSCQRLKEKVEEMQITLKAIQTNIDVVKKSGNDGNGTAVTEQAMTAWVNHFFSEQFGTAGREFKDRIDALAEKLTNKLTETRQQVQQLQEHQHLLEQKFQNTLQQMYEMTIIIYGIASEDVPMHSEANRNSPVQHTFPEGSKLCLSYVLDTRDDEQWMKARHVNPETAEIVQGWVCISRGDQMTVKYFSSTPA